MKCYTCKLCGKIIAGIYKSSHVKLAHDKDDYTNESYYEEYIEEKSQTKLKEFRK